MFRNMNKVTIPTVPKGQILRSKYAPQSKPIPVSDVAHTKMFPYGDATRVQEIILKAMMQELGLNVEYFNSSTRKIWTLGSFKYSSGACITWYIYTPLISSLNVRIPSQYNIMAASIATDLVANSAYGACRKRVEGSCDTYSGSLVAGLCETIEQCTEYKFCIDDLRFLNTSGFRLCVAVLSSTGAYSYKTFTETTCKLMSNIIQRREPMYTIVTYDDHIDLRIRHSIAPNTKMRLSYSGWICATGAASSCISLIGTLPRVVHMISEPECASQVLGSMMAIDVIK